MKQANIFGTKDKSLVGEDEPMLESDLAYLYPNAYLQFRIKCDELIPSSPV